MPDAAFQIVFWLIAGVVAVVVILTVLGMLVHFAFFGAVVGLVVKRIGAMHARQASSHAGRRCTHCASSIPATLADCPNCGAPTA
ncbi:MAG: hypothetical protein WBC44_16275 [Planctomycetaceae bacterium]